MFSVQDKKGNNFLVQELQTCYADLVFEHERIPALLIVIEYQGGSRSQDQVKQSLSGLDMHDDRI